MPKKKVAKTVKKKKTPTEKNLIGKQQAEKKEIRKEKKEEIKEKKEVQKDKIVVSEAPSLIEQTLKKEEKKEDFELLPQLQEATEKNKKKVIATMNQESVTTDNSDDARDLYNQSRYGTILEGGRVQLSFLEAMYLQEKGKLTITDPKGKNVTNDQFIAKAKKLEHNFWVKYCVYKDIRTRGYIIKTALKFGADFRVYDRGVKPGEDHARWVVYPIHEGQTLTWHDFAAKNRVAHSTKKRLLIGIVDAERDVTYYEIRWVRP
jgi:tRNA-intron endonuclease